MRLTLKEQRIVSIPRLLSAMTVSHGKRVFL